MKLRVTFWENPNAPHTQRYWWKLQNAGNNRTIADSAEGYEHRSDCIDMAVRIFEEENELEFVFTDGPGATEPSETP